MYDMFIFISKILFLQLFKRPIKIQSVLLMFRLGPAYLDNSSIGFVRPCYRFPMS